MQGDMSIKTLRYLLECHGECEHLDFKEELELDNDYSCANFGKDVLAMKNVGGGYIIIGVQDKTWKPVGITARLLYDTKFIRDKVRKASGLDIEVDIVQHEAYADGQPRLFAMILVRSATKRSKLRVPSLTKRDFHPNEKWGLRAGDIFVRIGDSTKRLDSQEELQKLLDDLSARYQEEELQQNSTLPAPFAVETGLYRLLPREYASFVGREEFKKALHEAVESDPRIWIVNLYGPGGVGKSALATWLAYEYYDERRTFEAILHLSAKNLELSTDKGIRHLRPTLVSLEDFLDRILQLFQHSEFCQSDLEKKKSIAIDILTAFRSLLILDNMETMSDGRIMEFVRSLPPKSQAKVLLTSRRRTSNWEFPIQLTEFSDKEIQAFVQLINNDLRLDLPVADQAFCKRIKSISGGLPLAIQWIIGEYAKTRDINRILSRTLAPDSPLLEFSFRNSWNVLDESAQRALAVLSIFDSPPTAQEWRIALEWSVEKLEHAINALVEVTFVSDRIEQRTGKTVYSALPITLSFARNELNGMPGLESEARIRYQRHQNRLQLATVETSLYSSLFIQFDAKTDPQKQAILLCRMAEGQPRTPGYKEANEYYRQALETEPRSVYALSSYGLFQAELGNYGEAIELLTKAASYCNKKTGYYVYFNLSRVYDQIRDRVNRIRCLRKALEYEPFQTIARHSLGVALSQSRQYPEALEIFDQIIVEELRRLSGPSDSIVYAYNTKIITLRRAGLLSEARQTHAEAVRELSKRQDTIHLIKRLEEPPEL